MKTRIKQCRLNLVKRFIMSQGFKNSSKGDTSIFSTPSSSPFESSFYTGDPFSYSCSEINLALLQVLQSLAMTNVGLAKRLFPTNVKDHRFALDAIHYSRLSECSLAQLGSLASATYCLFKPYDNQRIIDVLMNPPTLKELNSVTPLQMQIYNFHATYWISAWSMARSFPSLVNLFFGFSQELTDTLASINAAKLAPLFQLPDAFTYGLRYNSATMTFVLRYYDEPFSHLLLLHHIVQNEDEAITLGFTSIEK